MDKWLYNPDSPFYMWSFPHLSTIAAIILFLLIFYLWRKPLRPYRKLIRFSVGSLLIFSRISLDIWYVMTGEWNMTTSLPLELCSIASIMCGVMLLTKSRFLFNIFYFIAIGGAVQAIVTPALDFGFPQYRYFQFFIDHTLLVLAPLLLIWLYGYSVSFKAIWKSFLAINIIAAVVFMINRFIDANYMFLSHKPRTASLLDILGPYPYYLIALEGIVLLVFTGLYLPFSGWLTGKGR